MIVVLYSTQSCLYSPGIQNFSIAFPLTITNSLSPIGMLVRRSSFQNILKEVSKLKYWAFSLTSNIFLRLRDTLTYKERKMTYYLIKVFTISGKTVVQCYLPIHDLLIHYPCRFTDSYLFFKNFKFTDL